MKIKKNMQNLVTLTFSALKTNTATFANSADSDQKAS